MPDIDLQKMFLEEHDRAKQQRAADGFKDESFMPHAMVIDPEGKLIMIACAFSSNYEKMAAMNYIWKTAKDEKAVAVLFSSDARLIKEAVYLTHYGITKEEFDEHRQRTLTEVGGSYGDLPREVWEDVLITWCFGPSFSSAQWSTSYTEGPDDTVVFEESRHNEVIVKMMTKWW